MSPPAASLLVGDTVALTAVVYNHAGQIESAAPVEWTGDPAKVDIRANAVFTMITAGQTTIQARAGNRVGAVTLTVAPRIPPANVPAFQGAEGFGATSTGGRGGAVYVVDRLDDDPNADPDEGTLRYALSQTGPRTVVFAVAGEIQFEQLDLSMEHSNVTIAGQTAPGSGITLNGSIGVMADDVVIRYVRMRRFGNNGFSMIRGSRVILDHVSVQYHTDDAFRVWVDTDHEGAGPVESVTLSRSIVGPTTGKAIGGGWRGEDRQGDNLIVRRVDYHHNLFANNSHRTPRTSAQHAQVVNNVVYNSRFKMMESVHRTEIDYIGNYLRHGPMTEQPSDHRWIVHEEHPNGVPDELYPLASIYVEGNVGDPTFMDPDEDNWQMMFNGFNRDALPETHRRTLPLDPGVIPPTVQSAQEAYESVLADVGANRRLTCAGDWEWNQDALDASVVEQTVNRTGPIEPYQEPSQAGGFPDVVVGTPCPDSDRDGMPDAFEMRWRLAPSNAADGPADYDGDGFTNLEEFLNGTEPRSP